MMRRLSLTVAPLFVATLVGIASPAHADVARTAPVSAKHLAMDGSTVCVRSVDSNQCGAYQEALLRAVESKATSKRRAISVNDISTRQLDALIASVN